MVGQHKRRQTINVIYHFFINSGMIFDLHERKALFLPLLCRNLQGNAIHSVVYDRKRIS